MPCAMATSFTIHDLAPLGDGVHRDSGVRVYIERTLPGDVVEAKIQKAAGLMRGEVTRIVTPSPHRVTPPCPHYDVCGGCALQHASEGFYRDWKMETVRGILARAGVAVHTWSPPVFVPGGTRRRVTFAAHRKGSAVTLGYFRRRSHKVADIASCLVADPAIMALRTTLAPALAVILQDGKAADIFIQTVDGAFDVVITGPVGKKGHPDLTVLEAGAQAADALGLNRLSWRARDHDTPEQIVERAPFLARFGALDVPLPPLAFLQPTKAGEAALVDAVMTHLPASGRFADLFAGCGTFSGALLRRGPTDAFESAGAAVRALDKAKGAAPLRVTQRDLFRMPLEAEDANRYDAIVFDPPRVGGEAQARELAASTVKRIVGVSCNPLTFARDAKILTDGGYRLENVAVVDQFTWSHHVELVGAFTKDSAPAAR